MGHWWEGYPWRMVQTNLPEIDMEHMDAVRFAESLVDFGANVVMINAAGILASYDTKLSFHTKSAFLHGDSLEDMLRECHTRKIRVIARTDFSKISVELGKQHPDWLFRDGQGQPYEVNGAVQVCPSGEYTLERVNDILKELFTTLDFDGIFFNMSGAYVSDYAGGLRGTCLCDRCRRRYREATGQEAPTSSNLRDPAFMKYFGFQSAAVEKNRRRQYELIKSINPEVAVNGFDYTRGECNQDMGRAPWLYASSSMARRFSGPGRDRIGDIANVDYLGFCYRHTTVSPSLLELRHWQSLANSSSLSLYIFNTLDGHRDRSFYEPSRKVYRFYRDHESLYRGHRSLARTVLLRSGGWHSGDEETLGWVRALTESHIPFDELNLDRLNSPEDLAGKELVIVPDMAVNDSLAQILDHFAADGGTVLFTGIAGLDSTRSPIIPKCLGVEEVLELRKDLRSSLFELRPAEEPLFQSFCEAHYLAPGPDFARLRVSRLATGYLRMIPEHPFGPPERCYYTTVTEDPLVTKCPWGKGFGIVLPIRLGAFFHREGHRNSFAFLKDLLISICGVDSIAPALTEMAETVLTENNETVMIQLINGSGAFGNRFVSPLPIENIVLELKGLAPGPMTALRGGQVSAEAAETGLTIRLNRLKEYEAILIRKP